MLSPSRFSTLVNNFSRVDLLDAEEIVAFRSSASDLQLNDTSVTVAEQRSYLHSYIERERRGSELYVKSTSLNSGQTTAYFRLMGGESPSHFNWGSLVASPASTPVERLDVILAAYGWGFTFNSASQCGPFPVLRTNARIIKLHDRMGLADRVDATDDLNVWFQVDRDRYLTSLRDSWSRRGIGVLREVN